MQAPFHADPPPLPADALPERRRRAQWTELADTAAQAAVLQPKADAAVSACGVIGTVPDSVALDLGRLSRGYSLLYERSRNLAVDEELLDARDELSRILSYHLHMLRDAGDLAFSGRPDPRTEEFRRELAEGLGPEATRLLTLAGEYRARLLAAERGEPADPREPSARGEFELDDVELNGDDCA